MIRQFMNRQFLAFVVTGGLAACVNFGSRILYDQWLDFSSSVVLAYLTGMLTAFILARAFVFTQATQSVRRSAMFFVLVNGVAVLQTWAISMGLYYLLPLVSAIAQGPGRWRASSASFRRWRMRSAWRCRCSPATSGTSGFRFAKPAINLRPHPQNSYISRNWHPYKGSHDGTR